MPTPDFIKLHEADNVATALRNVPADETTTVADQAGRRQEITPAVEIRLGHKVALTEVAAGELLLKHGHAFGRATTAIARGNHVHVHNVISLSRETDIEPLADGE